MWLVHINIFGKLWSFNYFSLRLLIPILKSNHVYRSHFWMIFLRRYLKYYNNIYHKKLEFFNKIQIFFWTSKIRIFKWWLLKNSYLIHLLWKKLNFLKRYFYIVLHRLEIVNPNSEGYMSVLKIRNKYGNGKYLWYLNLTNFFRRAKKWNLKFLLEPKTCLTQKYIIIFFLMISLILILLRVGDCL